MAEPASVAGDGASYEPYGARSLADETRQSQMTYSNDTPTDINVNAVVARSQVLTIDVLGKQFSDGQDRRAMIQERFLSGVKAV